MFAINGPKLYQLDQFFGCGIVLATIPSNSDGKGERNEKQLVDKKSNGLRF
jgi:hypothetical protein